LGVNPATGQFVDRRTGLAYNPRPQTTNTDNNLSRIRRGSLNLSHASGVNNFGFSVFATDQKDLDNNNNNNNNNNNGSNGGDQTTWGVNASWSRQIDLRTGLTLTGGYVKGDGDNSENNNNNNNNNQSSDNFERYNFSIALNRTLSESLQGFVRYGFQKQTSKDNSNEFTENAVIVGLTYGFDL
jgi:uncharacterized protein (PEP-CTERM system associated)